jgi:hypothetical protein
MRQDAAKYNQTPVTKVLLPLTAVAAMIGLCENTFRLVVSGENTRPDKVRP